MGKPSYFDIPKFQLNFCHCQMFKCFQYFLAYGLILVSEILYCLESDILIFFIYKLYEK